MILSLGESLLDILVFLDIIAASSDEAERRINRQPAIQVCAVYYYTMPPMNLKRKMIDSKQNSQVFDSGGRYNTRKEESRSENQPLKSRGLHSPQNIHKLSPKRSRKEIFPVEINMYDICAILF